MKRLYSLLTFLIAVITSAGAQGTLPPFSTATAPAYHRIKFKTGGCHLQDNGTELLLTTNSARNDDGQLFAFIGTKSNFVLYSNKGNYVGIKKAQATNGQTGDLLYATADRSKAITLSIVNSSGGYFEIVRTTDTKKGMNQWGGAQSGVNLGFWNVGDTNNPLFFLDPNEVVEYEVTGVNSFSPENPLTLWYNRPATLTNVGNIWMEYSLPIGNGQLGASLFGGVKTDEIQFNEKTVWSGGPKNMDSSYGAYLNFGNLYVRNLNDAPMAAAGKRATDYVRFLDIEQGVGGVNYTDGDGTKYTRRYLSSEPDGVIAVQYKAMGSNKLHLLFSVKPGEGLNANNPTYTASGEGYFSGKLQTVYHNFRFKVVPLNGTLTQTQKGVEVVDATEVLLIMCGGTSFDSSVDSRTKGTALQLSTRIKTLVDAATNKGWSNLLADHVENFKSYMGRVSLQLNNAASNKDTESLIKYYNASEANKQSADGLFLEQLYFNYGRYLAISSSRGVNVPSNLQGIWNDKAKAPWNSDIHTNINVQMNYWPAEPTNLSDCHLPFLNYIIDNAKSANWKAAALRGGQSKGWTVFTESNIFGGMSTWGDNYFVANAWYCSHLWQHYRYTRDKAFLKRAFPAMWSSAEFWMERMIKDRGSELFGYQPDGKWVCPNEYSAEQNDHPREDGTAHAQQLVMDNLVNCLKAVEELGLADAGITADQLETLKDYIKNTDNGLHIEEYNVDDGKARTGKYVAYKGDWGAWATNNGIRTGDKLLKEWKYAPYWVSNDKGHRHMSHLMCLYPLNQVKRGDGYFEAAVNALKLRGDEATGWSMGWKVNLWARAKDGDHARKIIKNALKHSTSYGTNQYAGGIYYNLYDSHAPFQIDGNFGVCAGIAELLLQSHNDVIEILPALPSAWRNGTVTGLKAVGNFTVDIEWNNGVPTKVNVVSHKGAPLRISGADYAAVRVLVDGKGAEVIAETTSSGQPTVYLIKNVSAGQSVEIDLTKPTVPVGISAPEKESASFAIYDLSGRRVTQSAKGVLITNGKKVIR